MNEEQLEAASEHLARINERHHRLNGWRHGLIRETRRERIKRLRRWDNLPVHYPDRFTPEPDADNFFREKFRLVCQREINGIELFVTGFERKQPAWNWDKTDLLPLEDWDSITQLNGYCRFKRKPVHERGYDGMLSYVPVHGGITYCHHKFGVSTYGFDTAHASDEDNPLCRNVEWVEYQCLVMARGIQVAAQFEEDYLRFNELYQRAEIIDKYHARLRRLIAAPFELQNNLGAMINVLFGRL